MDFLASNLLLIFAGAALCIGFRIWGDSWFRCRRLIGWLGLLLLAVGGFGLIVVLESPPDNEDTELAPVRPEFPEPEVKTLVNVLQSDWDAADPPYWPISETLAEISQISYLDPHEAKDDFQSLGFEKVEPMVSKSMIGYVIYAENVAVIVFRGTDDPTDWIPNLDRFVARTKHGPAHRGFYMAYQPLAPQVAEILAEAKPKHLWVTGHSLGGALAVLCAYDLIENQNLEVDGLITFGQPMVARGELCDHLDEILARRFVHYVNQSDVVPRIPPSFEHCGSLVWYTGDEIRRTKAKPQVLVGAQRGDGVQSTGEDEEPDPLSNVEFRRLQAELRAADAGPEFAPDGTPLVKGNLPFVKDHDMGLYREAVKVSRE